MSRDQKPRRSKIVANAAPRRVAATSAAPTPDAIDPTPPAGPAKVPVFALAALFLVVCAAAGVGVALLPGLLR